MGTEGGTSCGSTGCSEVEASPFFTWAFSSVVFPAFPLSLVASWSKNPSKLDLGSTGLYCVDSLSLCA